jgi:multiple sugar transport system ATP-binding protein
MPREQREAKARWAAGLLSIGHLLERRPRELSGGERQRVALARAIVREPSVFLLDEPLSNLDAKLRASAREELEQFQRRVATTMIYVTHDQVEAMAMGDRVVVLHQGIVRQIGTPAEAYDEPADTFVAGFLGSPPMNLIESEEAVIGFRPEHLLPAGGAAPASASTLPFSFRLEHEEYLGSERILYGSVDGGRFDGKKVVSRLPATFHPGAGPGSVMPFQVERGKLKFFDRGPAGKRRAPVSLS